jgi:hypothetical protein
MAVLAWLGTAIAVLVLAGIFVGLALAALYWTEPRDGE